MKQCCATDGVEADYIRQEILPDYFRHFWNHRMALDRRNYKQVMFLTTTKRSAHALVNLKNLHNHVWQQISDLF